MPLIDSLRRNHVSLFLIVLFLFYGILVKWYDGVLVSLIIGTFLIHSLIFVFIKTGLKSLLLLVGSVFLFGCLGVAHFMINPELFTATTLFFIIVYSICLFIIWYLLYVQKVNDQVKEELQNKVESLEKYSHDEHIYRMKEFNDRARLIVSSCIRRKEDGYFVIITDQTQSNRKAKEAFHYTIGEVLVRSTRIHFDIVGEKDDQSYVVLLQNISKNHVDVVIERFYKELEKVVSLKDVTLSIDLQDIYKYRPEVEELK
ncbi:hypothetical protein [Bacillus massiliigorillae]|uniref:hypothetical protein n=1 Tax=Bacillus massiliigorillae TaxID=1243664 RepID=UPI0003A506A4|nr:hypothetical protein [Bacillus massiliigorillae]